MHACKLANESRRILVLVLVQGVYWYIHMQCGHGIPECPAYGYLSTEDVGKVGGTGNMGSMVDIWGNEKKERQEV